MFLYRPLKVHELPGKHSTMLHLLHKDYIILTFLSLSMARYSVIHIYIYMSELGHHGENENAQTSKQQQSGFEPGLSRLD